VITSKTLDNYLQEDPQRLSDLPLFCQLLSGLASRGYQYTPQQFHFLAEHIEKHHKQLEIWQIG
jgi:hypothetical protein